jgi:hypothetical protein
MSKTLLATSAILLAFIAVALLDVAEVLTYCAEKLNGVTWSLVGKCKDLQD